MPAADTSAPPLTTREIADRYRRDVNTVLGWINDGVLGPTVGRVHLRATKVGGSWLVAPSDLVEFIRALNPGTPEAPPAARGAREREAREADRRVRRELGMS